MQIFNEIRFDNLRGDLFGGVTAAIIALPMALAFGVASGAGPAAGLYGAVLVGLFAALFGGTPTLISEPTGPMTVIMTAVIANLLAANPALVITRVTGFGLAGGHVHTEGHEVFGHLGPHGANEVQLVRGPVGRVVAVDPVEVEGQVGVGMAGQVKRVIQRCVGENLFRRPRQAEVGGERTGA